MPKWLVPWFMTLAIAGGVVGAVLLGSVGLGAHLGGAVLVLLAIGAGIFFRLRYLKENPPNPELTQRPFWDFQSPATPTRDSEPRRPPAGRGESPPTDASRGRSDRIGSRE